MAKSIKFTDDIYLDSKGVLHKYNNYSKITLDEFLNSRKILDSKIAVRQSSNNYLLTSGNYIPWNEEVFNNSNGLLENYGSGLIKVNYTGYIKLSFSVWIGDQPNYRPWVRITNYDTNEIVFDAIDDNSSGYVSISASNIIIPVSSGHKFGISVIFPTGYGRINYGSGRGVGIYFVIEII